MNSPLRAERKKRKWSQTFVGKQVGLSAPQISRIETSGVKTKYMQKIFDLLKLFDYSISLEQISSESKTQDDTKAA